MNNFNNNEMQRGVVQATFNYLPNAHIDFYLRSTRTSYSALVKHWKTKPLTEINSRRVFELVQENLQSFVAAGGALRGYPSAINDTTCKILTPALGNNPAILAELDPLTFFCQRCKRAYSFKAKEDYYNREGVSADCCRHNLRQIMFTFPCECGYCGSIKVQRCSKHPDSELYYDTNNYSFICAECSQRIDMSMRCPDCKKILFPHAALDRSNLIAANLTLIDLLNSNEERFLSDAGGMSTLFCTTFCYPPIPQPAQNLIRE